MIPRWAEVLAFDFILLLAGYSVVGDLQWRADYATKVSHLVPSYTYLPLIRHFTMTGRDFPLVSPPTLDWLQIVLVVAVLVNLWYGYSYMKERRTRMQAS